MSLSRTSSTASEDTLDNTGNKNVRTRKRFSSEQLMMLEHLFHLTSHPSREEREVVAKQGEMEYRSVTIWFQNKRQMERKVALHINPNTSSHPHPLLSSSPFAPGPTTTTRSHSTTSTSSSRSRPSLDRIAARSELRSPQTPTRRSPPDPNASLWDNMPSSPLGPSGSVSPSRDWDYEYVEFVGKIRGSTRGRRYQPGGTKRTLEWACAAARLAENGGIDGDDSGDLPIRDSSRNRRDSGSHSHSHSKHDSMDMGDETEEDIEEAITPESTLGSGDSRWTATSSGAVTRTGTGGGTLTRAGTGGALMRTGSGALMRVGSSAPAVPTPMGYGTTKTSTTPTNTASQKGMDVNMDLDLDDETMRAALALCGLGRR